MPVCGLWPHKAGCYSALLCKNPFPLFHKDVKMSRMRKAMEILAYGMHLLSATVTYHMPHLDSEDFAQKRSLHITSLMLLNLLRFLLTVPILSGRTFLCPRTCPSHKSRLCAWFARPSGCTRTPVLSLPLSARFIRRVLRFRMGCHGLPRDSGCCNNWTKIPRPEWVCTFCGHNSLADENHLLF